MKRYKCLISWVALLGMISLGSLLKSSAAHAKVHHINGLGTSVGKPALAYLRIRNEIRAVVIAGCGSDDNPTRYAEARPTAPGRCMVVLRADTGEVIRKFTDGPDVEGEIPLSYPITGGVAAYPNSGTVPADRAYVGDAAGQLWRMDFRDADPNNWSVTVAWPTRNALESGGYRVGRAIEHAPSLSLARDGSLTVIFGTTNRGVAIEDVSSMMVSFADDVTLGDGERLSFVTTKNWVMPLRADEVVRGDAMVRSQTAFFTTLEQSSAEGQCVGAVARLYAVDYTRSRDSYNTVDGRRLDVIPRLPPVKTDGGAIVTDGIAFVLPQGVAVDGLAIVRSPSCVSEQEPTTEVILNYASSSAGAGTGDIEIERRTGERVEEPVDEELVRKGGQDVSIAVSLTGDLDNPQNRGAGGIAPFPRGVLYWGSSLTD